MCKTIPFAPPCGGVRGRDCLLQHLLAADDVDALLNLADALAGEAVDGTVLGSLFLGNLADAGSILACEEEGLDIDTGFKVSLACLDGAGTCEVEACGLAFGMFFEIVSYI